LDSLRYVTNPAFKKKADQERLIRNKSFGKTVAALREKAGLNQSEIRGLSDRQVRRIEKGTNYPSHNSLNLLATAHDRSIEEYLNAVAQGLGT